MSITGEEMAERIVTELTHRGRLRHEDSAEVDHDRRVVARILKDCLREAWRRSISPGPIAATLDELDLPERKTDPGSPPSPRMPTYQEQQQWQDDLLTGGKSYK